MNDKFKIGGVFKFQCYDEKGNLKWEEEVKNLVTNQGLQHFLDTELLDGTAVTSWYLGLTAGSASFAAADTLASHSGWTEFTDYTDNRKAYVGVRSSQTVSNTASVGSFAVDDTGTVGGAFLCSAATGTSGTLLSGSALSADRSVASGDTVNLTYTITAAAS